MPELRYPSVAEIIALHDLILSRLGVSPQPLPNEGALESALTRPPTAAWYEGADIVRQSALIAIGISTAQAFVDGNKRTAFAALDAFLWVDGWECVADPMVLARRLERLANPVANVSACSDAFAA